MSRPIAHRPGDKFKPRTETFFALRQQVAMRRQGEDSQLIQSFGRASFKRASAILVAGATRAKLSVSLPYMA